MSGLLRRLRDALRPDFRVESELASGGMARVFLARDASLERKVAVKVLRPELATATGARRFLREARLLARVAHPNVVTVHEVGERGGLFYCVLDWIDGETLEERLATGPLGTSAALELGHDLLSALGAAHAQGVVHRDVKPANLVLGGGVGAVLVDFGVATAVARTGEAGQAGSDALTAPDARPGTPGWMAPEQAAGGTASPRTDLYAAARVVYEAATGRSWSVGSDPDRADWRGLPRRVAKVLARGLDPDPDDRWEDADAFRRALAEGSRSRRWPAAAALLVIGLLTIVGVRSASGPAETASAPAYDLALLPCETVARGDSLVGDQVARVAALYLEHLPRLRVVPHFRAFRWWRSTGRASEEPYRAAARELNAVHVARCTVEPSAGGRLRVAVELTGADGDVLPPQVVEAPSAAPPIEAGDALGLTIVRALRPRLLLSGEGHTALAGHDREAVRAFLLGEDAFQRDARRRAADYYEAALTIDPELALARWRLVDLRRYLLAPAVEEDLAILAASTGPFGPVDRLMLDARLAPPGPERLARYRELLDRAPEDPYALFTYGDELFHRGPLAGVGQDSALAVLRAAARRDPFLAPAHDHLAIALIRAGHGEEAARAVDRLAELKGEDAERDLFHPEALRHAWDERFDARRAAERRPVVFGEGALETGLLGAAARLSGPYLDVPHTEVALGAMLAARAASRDDRASGRTAEGLGLLASGRFEEGLARLDRAAALAAGPEGRLHAALWRLLPSAMGLDGVDAPGIERGREALATIVADGAAGPLVRAQAAWGLALDAVARGDAAAERRWSRELASHEGAPGLERAASVLAGWREAGRGEPEAALRRTAPVLSYREADRTEWPFLRAALHLGRGRWLAALGRPEEADRSLLWHEAVDLAGVPVGVAQAGEVDWALGAHADLLRARLHRDGGRLRAACRSADRVLRRWPEPDTRLRGAREEAAAIRREACGA